MSKIVELKLRELAQAASPGPWYDDGAISGDGSVVMSEQIGFRIAHLPDTKNVTNHADDAAYIAAANPATVLEMIDDMERMREALEKVIMVANGTGYGLFANIARAALRSQ